MPAILRPNPPRVPGPATGSPSGVGSPNRVDVPADVGRTAGTSTGNVRDTFAPSTGGVSTPAADPSGLDSLHHDPLWGKLTSITGRQMPNWDDNLAYATAFKEAFGVAKALQQKGFTNPLQGRELVNQLLNLMPPSMQWDAAFSRDGLKEAPSRVFNPLPKEITDRYPDFKLKPGDLPKLGPAFKGLDKTKAELSSAIFRDGQQGVFFAPDDQPVKIDRIIEENGQKVAVCTSLPIHRYTIEPFGFCKHEETKPAQGDLKIPVKDLEARVFGQSRESSPGLSPSSAEDRMLALTYSHELKQQSLTLNGQTRTVFEWIEAAGQGLSMNDLRTIQTGAQDAATRAVGKYTAHPRRIHFKLDTGADWGKECTKLLGDITSSSGSRYTTQRFGGDQSQVDERNWTSQFLGSRDSFITGNANCYGSGEMRAKLLNGVLRPLGIWPEGTAVSHNTHGAFFERFATPDPATGAVVLSEPVNVKMNERTWHYQSHIGIGLGDQHGGRFELHAGGQAWDPQSSSPGYESFAERST